MKFSLSLLTMQVCCSQILLAFCLLKNSFIFASILKNIFLDIGLWTFLFLCFKDVPLPSELSLICDEKLTVFFMINSLLCNVSFFLCLFIKCSLYFCSSTVWLWHAWHWFSCIYLKFSELLGFVGWYCHQM